MEDNKLKNGIEEIKNIKMTALEKKQIFENILNSAPANPIKSSWFSYSFIARIQKNHLAYYIVVPLIIVITSGGVVFASENSLPDSVLYPIKVSVVEPIRETLTFSAKAKANYESGLATKRMVEAETLAIKGKLDISKEEQINTLLVKHSKKLNEAIDKIEEKNRPEQVDEIITNFQAEMNAHAKVLDSITSKKEDKEEKENREEKREKEIKKENKREKPRLDNVSEIKIEDSDFKRDTFSAIEMISEEVEEKKVNQISASARINADNIGNRINTKQYDDKKDDEAEEDNNDENSDRYKRRKDSIRSLINKTNVDVDFTVNENSDSTKDTNN